MGGSPRLMILAQGSVVPFFFLRVHHFGAPCSAIGILPAGIAPAYTTVSQHAKKWSLSS